MKTIVVKKMSSRMRKKIVISRDCKVAQSVETACGGLSKNTLCKLWGKLKIKNLNKFEIKHIKDKIYYIKNKDKEGLVEIPEIITKLGLNIMFEYLAKNPKLCDRCSLLGKKDSYSKNLFV